MPDTYNLLTILGPTASGKTRLAVALAGDLDGEIISADSRQVFRGMDIGSGKDLHEYGAIPYHLIDVLDSGDEFSVFAFLRLFRQAFDGIAERGHLPILCGGTGLYLDGVLRGYRMAEVPENRELREQLEGCNAEGLEAALRTLKPELHNTSDLTDRQRTIRAIEIAQFEQEHAGQTDELPSINSLNIGIRWEREALRARITERLRQRLEAGMIDEVQRLHDGGVPWERLDYYGLEYRYLGAFLQGKLNRNDMFQKLNSAIHDFAKRQENWFRKMERNGIGIHWVAGDGDPLAEALALLRRHHRGNALTP